MNKTTMLFLIIFIEGYVVLASELLAIRLLIPFVGSGTETISIVISAVLLPLAIGYHFGGTSFRRHYAKSRRRNRRALSIRRILLRNLTSALAIMVMGLSYLFLEVFFGVLTQFGITSRLVQTFIYSALFVVYPVFLLGQTVPLISNYFSRSRLSEITGKMLFFSTVGSFMGSVFSTIILMMTIGVHHTALFTLTLLTALVLVLSRRLLSFEPFYALALLALMYFFNGEHAMRMAHIVSNNAYNTVSVIDMPATESRALIVNRSNSSVVAKDPQHEFKYVRYIEDNFISHISLPLEPKRRILVIGAGGFTIGQFDDHNDYTFVDIDPALKRVAEEDFLQKKLGENKHFVPMSARAFVHSTKEKFDLVILDAYTNVYAIPMECITREFLVDVKNLLTPNAIVVGNIISSPTFEDRFTQRYHNTFMSVFPHSSRQVIGAYNGWRGVGKDEPALARNVLYIYYQKEKSDAQGIYTDDHNTYSIDR